MTTHPCRNHLLNCVSLSISSVYQNHKIHDSHENINQTTVYFINLIKKSMVLPEFITIKILSVLLKLLSVQILLSLKYVFS